MGFRVGQIGTGGGDMVIMTGPHRIVGEEIEEERHVEKTFSVFKNEGVENSVIMKNRKY